MVDTSPLPFCSCVWFERLTMEGRNSLLLGALMYLCGVVSRGVVGESVHVKGEENPCLHFFPRKVLKSDVLFPCNNPSIILPRTDVYLSVFVA